MSDIITPEDIRARVRIRKRMDRVDDMPPDLRACVHEFGLAIVDAFVACGVTNPRRIRHLVMTVRDGSGEIGKRGSRDGSWLKPLGGDAPRE